MDLEESGIETPDFGEQAEDLGSLGLEVEGAEGELPERFVEEQEVVEEEAAFAPAEEEAPIPEPPPPPPPKAPPPVRAKPAPPPPVPTAARVPTDVQKVLDEVDSYVSLGFVEDAKDALREVMGRHPGNSAIAAKVAELGLDLEEEAAPAEEAGVAEEPSVPDMLGELPVPAPAAPADEAAALVGEGAEPGGIDLGAELGELFGTQSAVGEPTIEAASTDLGDAGLADIFKEFKKGVDKQLGKEDYDTRYNLGIAYKEMGLVDEAIAEFQLAAKDESRVLECSSMLGICFMEKGMPKLAVKWFEKGLKAPGRTPEEYQGLRYDLAMAHEASGDADTALSIFTDLYGQDASFRDVAAQVRELKAALG
jgi:tetratricopeptide (TPR) repeat protein